MDFNSVLRSLTNWMPQGNFFDSVHHNTALGAGFAVGSLAFIVLVLGIQNKNTAKVVRQYRHYEIALIVRKRLSVHRLVDYHRNIAWRDFAAISSGSALAGAALLFGGGTVSPLIGGADNTTHALTQVAATTVIASIAVQVASAVVMMVCDFVHTNTISPLVPPLQRMKIVGEAIVLGGAAMIFNIAAVISFMSVFSAWVSIFCSIIFAFVVITLTGLRAIEVKELRRWLKMGPEADGEWNEIDQLVRRTSKAKRDRIFEESYYEKWAADYEDPCQPPSH